jgi:TonB family protein
MQEAVSAVLVGRRQQADGLSRMLTLSLGVHLAFVAALAIVPASWLTSEAPPQERAMMISLGGAAGQDTGGMTSIASRQVQERAADPRTVTRTPANTPEMVAPAPEAKPTPAKPVTRPAEKATTKKPSTGKEVQPGPARADTPNAAVVPFGGLSSSSAGGLGGVRVEGDFCCPEYIEAMKRAIYNNWNPRQGVVGTNEVKFVIRRDGQLMLTTVAIEKSSNNPLLDLESRRAVLVTQRVPPLPDRYTNPTLTIILIFEYRR